MMSAQVKKYLVAMAVLTRDWSELSTKNSSVSPMRSPSPTSRPSSSSRGSSSTSAERTPSHRRYTVTRARRHLHAGRRTVDGATCELGLRGTQRVPAPRQQARVSDDVGYADGEQDLTENVVARAPDEEHGRWPNSPRRCRAHPR